MEKQHGRLDSPGMISLQEAARCILRYFMINLLPCLVLFAKHVALIFVPFLKVNRGFCLPNCDGKFPLSRAHAFFDQ